MLYIGICIYIYIYRERERERGREREGERERERERERDQLCVFLSENFKFQFIQNLFKKPFFYLRRSYFGLFKNLLRTYIFI